MSATEKTGSAATGSSETAATPGDAATQRRDGNKGLDRYPPPGHFLRWLRITVDTTDPEIVTGSMPVLPELLDHTGGCRLGAIATFADFVAGILSVRVAAPSWIATQDLQLHVTGHPGEGTLRSTSRTTRAGRSTIVSETELTGEDGSLVALSIVTYSRLSRQDVPATAPPAEVREYRDAPGIELPRQPVAELLGFRLATAAADPDGPGRTTLTFDHPPVLRNSTGAIQGGVLACSMDELATALAEQHVGRQCRASFLHLNYLAQGRTPPFETRGRILATDGDETLCRLEVVELASDRRLAAGLVRTTAR